MHTLAETEIAVAQGNSWIDVRGVGFDCCLFLRGRAWLYHWDDCQGSVGQELIYLLTAGDTLSLHAFCESLLDIGAESDLPRVSSHLAPLLAPSKYHFALLEVSAEHDFRPFPANFRPEMDSLNYYPGFGSFVATQPDCQLSQERIAYFEGLIRAGGRPAMLCIKVKSGWSDFILDGHHRHAAYVRCGVPIRYVAITRLDPPAILPNDQLSLMPHNHPQRDHAIALKRDAH